MHGTQTEPIVLGDPGGDTVEVTLNSPILPGSRFGETAWVTGNHVQPFIDGGYLTPVVGPVQVAKGAAK